MPRTSLVGEIEAVEKFTSGLVFFGSAHPTSEIQGNAWYGAKREFVLTLAIISSQSIFASYADSLCKCASNNRQEPALEIKEIFVATTEIPLDPYWLRKCALTVAITRFIYTSHATRKYFAYYI